jgi:hypothetical protein
MSKEKTAHIDTFLISCTWSKKKIDLYCVGHTCEGAALYSRMFGECLRNSF